MNTSPLDDTPYQLLFETSADALLIVSRDSAILAANQAVSETLGYPQEEILALSMRELLARPSHWDRLCVQIEESETVRDQLLKCRTKAGRQMDCLLSATLIRAPDGTITAYQTIIRDISILGYQSIVRDKTQRQRAEAALLNQAEELARTNAALEEKERLLIAFQRIGQVTLESLDIGQILDSLAQQLVQAGIFRSLMVALVDEVNQSVEVLRNFMCQTNAQGERIPGSVIEPTQNLKGISYRLDDDNITAEVARSGQMQILEEGDERLDSRVDDPDNFSTKISYFIPVQRGNRVLAVLATGSNPDAKEEMLHHIEVMQPLLNEVGIALEHALLYQALQHTLAEVENLKNRLQSENTYLQDEIKVVHNFEEIVSQSPVFLPVLEKVEQVAVTDATVLILGESGTGKELLARAVHSTSPRQPRPLVKINCAALPRDLIESELFGHERGAFTGAHARKIGRFELADGGTIFLDEIGELPLDLQTKLLRVLQEGEFERLGGSQTIAVDVRVIAATNRDLEKAVAQGDFRQDLYYRLNVFPIYSPPLRQRPEDIPVLAHHFIAKYGKKIGKEIASVPHSVMAALQAYPWPGNVRELENIIERAIILSRDGQLQLDLFQLQSPAPVLLDQPLQSPAPPPIQATVPSSATNERDLILQALDKTRWNRRQAARDLGMPYSTLRYKLLRLHIE